MLSTENYRDGDIVEISSVTNHEFEATIFFGGHSPASSKKSIKISNRSKYTLDGSQQIFLVLDVTTEATLEKPYF